VPLGINPQLDEFLQTRCFAVVQTGPWEGPGTWCWRSYCLRCDWSELHTTYEDARAAVRVHKPAPTKAAKRAAGAHKLPRGPRKTVKLPGKRLRPIETIKWEEEFF
jgi:hypothetical protein